jgi:hypothetical protein
VRAQHQLFVARVLFSLIFGSPAHAGGWIIGKEAVKTRESDQPALCRIEIQSGDVPNNCSGTLVGPNEIATAAHCFGRNYNRYATSVSVYCGGRYAEVENVELPAPNHWVDDIKPLPSIDYARITLSKGLSGSMPKAKSADAYFAQPGEPLPGVRCWMAGFGNSRSDSFGTLYIADLSSYSLVYGAGVITLRDRQGGLLKVSVDHGDSGGALYCRAPGKGVELVGVIVSYVPQKRRDQNRVENLFAPIWSQSL